MLREVLRRCRGLFVQRAIAEPAALGDWCARPQGHSMARAGIAYMCLPRSDPGPTEFQQFIGISEWPRKAASADPIARLEHGEGEAARCQRLGRGGSGEAGTDDEDVRFRCD